MEKGQKIAELRLRLHKTIDSITDAAKLEAINTLLQTAGDSHNAMSIDEYVGAIDEARKQVKDGQFLTIDEIEKESENW